jgi:hypothetical protein
VPAAQGFQGVADFHVNLGLLFAGYIRSPLGTVNASRPPVVRRHGLLYSSFREFKLCSVAATVF